MNILTGGETPIVRLAFHPLYSSVELLAFIGEAITIKNGLLISETDGLNDRHFKNRNMGYHLHP
jgi:hypothetical protein